MAKYEAKSVFLPALNNEKDTTKRSNLRKSNFADVNSAMFVMFSEDTMLNPKETAWFQQYDKTGKIQPLD